MPFDYHTYIQIYVQWRKYGIHTIPMRDRLTGLNEISPGTLINWGRITFSNYRLICAMLLRYNFRVILFNLEY